MATGASVPQGLPVQIGTHQFLVEPDKVRRTTIPAQRQAYTTDAPGITAVNTEGSWTKIISSWHHGMGQRVYDAAYSDPERAGLLNRVRVDTPGHLTLRLAPAESIDHATGSMFGQGSAVSSTTGYVWGVESGALVRYTIDTSGQITGPTTVTGITNPTGRVAVWNGQVYATDGSSIYRGSFGGTVSSWSTQDADLVAVCNGRFIAGHDEVIYEINSSGTASPVYTHPEAGDWKYATGHPGAIYAAYLTDSVRSTIYVWDDLDTTGSLAAPKVAAVFPEGERVNTMLSISGNLLAIGTTAGMRLALSGADGTLTLGPVISAQYKRDINSTSYESQILAVNSLAIIGSHLFASIATGEVVDFDLSVFTADLVPAWTIFGLNNGFTGLGSGHVNVISFGTSATYPILVVAGGGGTADMATYPIPPDGFRADTAHSAFAAYETTGTYDTGWITYGTARLKQPVELVIRHEPLSGGATITAQYVTSAISTSTLTAVTSATTYTTYSLTDKDPDERFAIRVTLNRGSTTSYTPVITGLELRVIPVLPRQDEIILPVILRTTVQGVDGTTVYRQDVLTEYDYLQGLISGGVPVSITEGGKTYEGLVDQVSLPGDGEQDWDDNTQFYEGTYLVRIISPELT